MPENSSKKTASGSWGRLRTAHLDALEVLGLPSKGDTRLLNFKTQETFYGEIIDRYMTFCSDAGHGAELDRRFSSLQIDGSAKDGGMAVKGTISPVATADLRTNDEAASAKALPNILAALRKLREGIVASKRVDDFAVQVYLFCIRVSILAKQPESYHPAILHLLRVLHVQSPLTSSEVEEVSSYLALDAACRRRQLAEAVSVCHKYEVRNTEIRTIIYSVIHDNYYLFRKTERSVGIYRARLMEWADSDMRLHTLKCLGRTYHSVSLQFLENTAASTWDDLVRVDGVGWERDSNRVNIRKARSQ